MWKVEKKNLFSYENEKLHKHTIQILNSRLVVQALRWVCDLHLGHLFYASLGLKLGSSLQCQVDTGKWVQMWKRC